MATYNFISLLGELLNKKAMVFPYTYEMLFKHCGSFQEANLLVVENYVNMF